MNNIHIKTISADRFTPYVVFKKLNGIALLESAILEQGKSRYSIVLVEEAFRLILEEQGIVLVKEKQQQVISENKAEYLELLKKYGDAIQITTNIMEIPLPVKGIGYLSYEMCQYFDEIELKQQKDILNIPEAIFSFGSVFVIFDHYKDDLHIVSIGHQQESEAKLIEKTNKIVFRLMDNDFRAYQTDESKYSYSIDFATPKSEFTAGVEEIKKEIIKGNLLQGVISRIVSLQSELPPLEAYRRLRRDNPSPYLFFLNFGDFTLFGSSPEIMVQLQGSTAVLKPIAGTRPRGKNISEDQKLEKELLADPKEQAEHLMLLDLGRNDLGRIAVKDSVKVTSHFGIERYAHVMHIVSEIEAVLAPQKNICDLIKATFPAGTVSGAPKIQAIETLVNLEKTKRGPYAGLVGYFDINGNFDSCITIRSALHKNGKYYFQSGAGIVYDSDPEKEYQETINKAQAMINILGVKEL